MLRTATQPLLSQKSLTLCRYRLSVVRILAGPLAAIALLPQRLSAVTVAASSAELLANCRLAQSLLCDCSEIDAELVELGQEIEVVTELARKAIYESARKMVNQDEFNERNNSYLDRHRKATERVAELEGLRRERQSKFLMLEGFVQGIDTRPLILDEFDEKLWAVAVETARVMSDGRLMYSFKSGAVVEDSPCV